MALAVPFPPHGETGWDDEYETIITDLDARLALLEGRPVIVGVHTDGDPDPEVPGIYLIRPA